MLTMKRILASCIVLPALVLMACSDDDQTKSDQRVVDAKVDSAPAVDQSTTDQPNNTDTAEQADGAADQNTSIDTGPLGDLSTSAVAKLEAIAFVQYLAGQLPGAGSTPDKVETYVPADNAVTGWVEDTGTGKPGVEAGYTTQEIEAIIDGSHDPYAEKGCDGFALQDYVKGAFKLHLFIWDMQSATGAQEMLDKNKKDGEVDSGLTFETIPSAADQAIIADDLPDWRIYGQKDQYIYKILLQYL